VLAQLTRVATIRVHGDKGLGKERLIECEGLESRVLPGLVAIEGEDHPSAGGTHLDLS
jgi:hypothetical protein